MIVAKPFVRNDVGEGNQHSTGRPILLPGHHARRGRRAGRAPISAAAPTSCRRPTIRPRSCSSSPRARRARRTYAYDQEFKPGEQYTRRRHRAAARSEELRRAARDRSGDRRRASGSSATRRLSASGVLTTASGLVFAGDGDGNIMAFESKTGQEPLALPAGRRRCDRRRARPTWSTAGSICSCRRAATLTAFALPQR